MSSWCTNYDDPRVVDQKFEAFGLLKAFIEPTFLNIPGIDWDKYKNRPERLGVTIAYGKFPRRLLCGIGEIVLLHLWDVVLGGETVSINVSGGYEGTGIDTYQNPGNNIVQCLEMGDIETWTPANHMTLGWVDGSAAVVAGKEMAKWNDDRSLFPSIFPLDLDWEIVRNRDGSVDKGCMTCLKARVEFLPFSRN